MIVLSQKDERERVEVLRFSPDGRSLLTPLPGKIRIWEGLPNVSPPRIIPDILAMLGPAWNACFTPDGKAILVHAQPLALCDLNTGTVRQIPLWNTSVSSNCYFALAPDGKHFVAIQSNYGTPAGWITCRPIDNPTADHAVWERELPRSVYYYPVFLSEERFVVREAPPLLESNRHKAVPRFVVCSVQTGEVVSEWENRELDLAYLTVSPNRELLVGRGCTRIAVFPATDFSKPLVVIRNTSRKDFTGMAFHPSGKYLAATSNDETVKLYDTTIWEVSRTFTWKIGRMRSIAFSPDGTLAAAGSDKGQIVVWDVDL